jgi:hypothetical protein
MSLMKNLATTTKARLFTRKEKLNWKQPTKLFTNSSPGTTNKSKTMSKAQSKHEYFHKGFDNQKRPDIVIDLRRPSADTMAKWTPEQKKHLPAFIKTCEAVFAAFVTELKEQKP